MVARLSGTVRQDVASLNDYDTHLANKVQLLLDATRTFTLRFKDMTESHSR